MPSPILPAPQLPRRLLEQALDRQPASAIATFLGDLLDEGKRDHLIYEDTRGNLVLAPERRARGRLDSLLGLFIERRLVPQALLRRSERLREARALVPVVDPRKVLHFIEQGLAQAGDAASQRLRSGIDPARVVVFGPQHVAMVARSWIPAYTDLQRERAVRAEIRRLAPDLVRERQDHACRVAVHRLHADPSPLPPQRLRSATCAALNGLSVRAAVERLALASGWDERDIEPAASVACANGAGLHDAFTQEALGDDHPLVLRLARDVALEHRLLVLARTLDVDRLRAERVAVLAFERTGRAGRDPAPTEAEMLALADDLLDSRHAGSAMQRALAQMRRENSLVAPELFVKAAAATALRHRQDLADTLRASRRGFLDARPRHAGIGTVLDTLCEGQAQRLLPTLREELDLLHWERAVQSPSPERRARREALRPLAQLLEQHLVGACDRMGLDLARQPDVAARHARVTQVYENKLAQGLEAARRGIADLTLPAEIATALQEDPGSLLREAMTHALQTRAGDAAGFRGLCTRVRSLLDAGCEALVRARIATTAAPAAEGQRTLLAALRFAAQDGLQEGPGRPLARDRSRPVRVARAGGER